MATPQMTSSRDSKWISFETTSEWIPRVNSLIRKMRTLSNAKSILEGTHARAAIYILGWIQRNFRDEGRLAHEGTGWVPLKPSTVARRRHGTNKSAGTVKILQDKGWLRNLWKVDYRSDGFAVQSMVDYGVYHDSDKPRKKLPQRKILPRTKQIQSQIQKLYKDRLIEVINA